MCVDTMERPTTEAQTDTAPFKVGDRVMWSGKYGASPFGASAEGVVTAIWRGCEGWCVTVTNSTFRGGSMFDSSWFVLAPAPVRTPKFQVGDEVRLINAPDGGSRWITRNDGSRYGGEGAVEVSIYGKGREFTGWDHESSYELVRPAAPTITHKFKVGDVVNNGLSDRTIVALGSPYAPPKYGLVYSYNTNGNEWDTEDDLILVRRAEDVGKIREGDTVRLKNSGATCLTFRVDYTDGWGDDASLTCIQDGRIGGTFDLSDLTLAN